MCVRMLSRPVQCRGHLAWSTAVVSVPVCVKSDLVHTPYHHKTCVTRVSLLVFSN